MNYINNWFYSSFILTFSNILLISNAHSNGNISFENGLRSSLSVKRSLTREGAKTEETNFLQIIGAKNLHAKGFTGKGKAIVIDNYIDPAHIGLSKHLTQSSIHGQYQPGEMSLGHGTHVAGLYREVAPSAKIKFLTAYGQSGEVDENSIFDALDNAAKSEGDVVNLSLMLSKKQWNPISGEMGYADVSLLIQHALKQVVDSGKVVFIALGNEYEADQKSADNYSKKLLSLVNKPEFKGMIQLVGSTEYKMSGEEHVAPYSNRPNQTNSRVIMAPGSDILSATPSNKYGLKSGTSMATPISGASYLLLKAALPGLSPDEILKLMNDSARKKSLKKSVGLSYQYGNGVLDLTNALHLGLKKEIGSGWGIIDTNESLDDWSFVEEAPSIPASSPHATAQAKSVNSVSNTLKSSLQRASSSFMSWWR